MYSIKSEKFFGLFRKIHKIQIIAAAPIRAKTVEVVEDKLSAGFMSQGTDRIQEN
jgi:hypothetical protein